VFLAHFTSSGINGILELDMDDYLTYLDEAEKIYKVEMKAPKRVVLVGIEK
jgi:hypothetical protein